MSVNDKVQTPEVILEAGGIVWKETSHGSRVAVIHRPQHKDWCLPKGKLKEGETFRDAACREVKEETGCTVRVTNFAGSISYRVQSTIKIVLFWSMVPEGEFMFQPTKEVDEIKWLTTREAFRKLSHQEQKNLLVDQRSGWGSFGLEFIRKLWEPKLRRHRLSGSLQAYRIELSHQIECKRGIEGDNLLWADASSEALSAAEMALNEGNIDAGWKLLHAARRMEIFRLKQDEVEAKAEALRHEAAEKLSGWRKNTIEGLLPTKKDGQQTSISNASLFEATTIRDERSDNLYYKIALLQNQMGILSVVLLIALSLLLLLARLGRLPLGQGTVDSSWEMLSAVMLFGILGGTVSGALSLARTSTRSKITEQIADRLITLMRIFVGAAAALVVYMLLQSAIFPKVFAFEVISSGTVFFLSFVAGFSERLIIRAVESVVGRER